MVQRIIFAPLFNKVDIEGGRTLTTAYFTLEIEFVLKEQIYFKCSFLYKAQPGFGH